MDLSFVLAKYRRWDSVSADFFFRSFLLVELEQLLNQDVAAFFSRTLDTSSDFS